MTDDGPLHYKTETEAQVLLKRFFAISVNCLLLAASIFLGGIWIEHNGRQGSFAAYDEREKNRLPLTTLIIVYEIQLHIIRRGESNLETNKIVLTMGGIIGII